MVFAKQTVRWLNGQTMFDQTLDKLKWAVITFFRVLLLKITTWLVSDWFLFPLAQALLAVVDKRSNICSQGKSLGENVWSRSNMENHLNANLRGAAK